MDKNLKLHLWIPESEIQDVSKTPTSRPHDYGVSHQFHGGKLSQGLQDIIDIFDKVHTGSSLRDEDLITFKIILQENEDISAQKQLIEDEGLKINAVKDRRRAVVSAPKDVFGNLQQRINRYRDHGIKKDFQYIEGFEPFRGEDKQSASLIRYYRENPTALTVDIQMMLLPEMGDSVQKRVQDNLAEKIEKSHGKIQGEPYQLSDGTGIIRAIVPMSSLSDLAEDPGIYRIEKTAFFHNMQPNAVTPFTFSPQLDSQIDINTLPVVVVLDDGVSFPDSLEALTPIHWAATGCTKTAIFGSHGTPVASRVVFEALGSHIGAPTLTPRARIIDAQVVDAGTISGDLLLKRIREAVQTFAPIAKIFNLSYNASVPIEGDEMSFLGCELDLLSRKYSIRFVISAGNHKLVFSQDSLKDIIDDDDSRIAEPADAMLGITVGAVVGYDHANSLSKRNEIAPYSRRGPGFSGFYKPDLVAYGATQFKNGIAGQDEFALCMSKTGYCSLAGTSFTAPTVAGDLAQVMSVLPDDDVNLAQALLYNGTLPLYDKTSVSQEEMDLAGNLFGRGLSAPQNSMYSSENRVTFVNTGTMNRLTKKRVKFHIPTVIAEAKVKRGAKKVRVTVTCIARPPVDRTKGTEYSAAYISASIHRLNSNGTNVVDNPSVSDNRTKWDTCYHFSNDFSSFDSGSWEIWLELYTRWGVEDDEEIPYALVITVDDLTEAGNLYSETVRETAGRYTPVQRARVTIR